jgi:murein DD-endopeptidase MepM/ murein hydrolase activator NlpD
MRIRILCVVMFCGSTLLPPFIPKEAYAQDQELITPTTPQFLLVEDGFLMKSSSLTKQGSRRAFAQGTVIKAAKGDTVEALAQKYGISPETIRWANKIEPTKQPAEGQELVILPVNGVLHTVSRGQTVARIAELYGVEPDVIAQQNHLEGDFILAGQELIIPGAKPILGGADLAFRPPAFPTPPAPGGGTPGRTDVISPKYSGTPTYTDEPTDGALQWPCADCQITQGFHNGHLALDIQTRGGGPIFAAEDGVVIRADTGWNGGYGNVIEIDHGNGLVTLYGHNKEFYVAAGDKVTRGQKIAWMGNTGRVHGPTGIHVHFEVIVNGTKRNPLLYLQ